MSKNIRLVFFCLFLLLLCTSISYKLSLQRITFGSLFILNEKTYQSVTSRSYKDNISYTWTTSFCPRVEYYGHIVDKAEQFGKVRIVNLDNIKKISMNYTKWNSRKDIIIKPADYICSKAKSTSANIVLATTAYFKKKTNFIVNNTLHNWSLLLPEVQPILYVTPDQQQDYNSLVQTACDLGWWVYVASECSVEGLPVLRTMMSDVKARLPDKSLIGYANSDILFNQYFIPSLKYMIDVYENNIVELPSNIKRLLMVGQRKDLKVKSTWSFSALEDISKASRSVDYHEVFGIDYFITTNDYPWEEMPPFVVSKPKFDNWLVWSSLHDQHTLVVDATTVLNATHISRKYKKSGWKKVATGDIFYNKDIYEFNKKGWIDCIPAQLIMKKNKLTLNSKKKFNRICYR